MARLALLLRGINVGGNNRIAMADLRALLESLGYAAPKTLLNSGNAVVDTDDDPVAAERVVSQAIAAELGLDIRVMARTHDELAAIVAADPLRQVVSNPSTYAVVFLSAPPAAGLLESVDPARYAPEAWALLGRELFVWYANGQARTTLTGTFWEKRLQVAATARNWNTVLKLADLTAA